jgi:hypothetical protein
LNGTSVFRHYHGLAGSIILHKGNEDAALQ